MVQDQGLDVYLAPFADITKRYQQHAVPAGSPNFTGDPNEVYIEAIDGERFIIVVDLMKWFDMGGATHLRILHEIDQSRDASGHARAPNQTTGGYSSERPPHSREYRSESGWDLVYVLIRLCVLGDG